MESGFPEHVSAFFELFARAEHALRRIGFVQSNRAKAVVDWRAFARDLREEFFVAVRNSGRADTLIREPPRAYHGEAGWQPRQSAPIADTEDLFIRGVCQVRNNIVHGEKYIFQEGERSDDLVKEATWVLEQAINTHRQTSVFLKEKMQR